MMACWKEIICFEYALFVEYANFAKPLMVCCFGCHGNMNLDNSFVNLNLALIIGAGYIICAKIINLILCLRAIFCCEYALFCKITEYLMVWLP